MDVLGNPLLSKNFMYSGLILTDTALFYRVTVEDNTMSDRVFLTDSPEVICSLMALPFREVVEADEHEFYEMLIKSSMFKLHKFKEVRDNNTSWMLEAFSEFLKETDLELNMEYTPVRMGQFENLNPNFDNDLKDSIMWLSEGSIAKRTRINGKTIKQRYPDYDMTKLSDAFPKFWNSFPSKKEAALFIIKSSDEKVHEHFLEVTE